MWYFGMSIKTELLVLGTKSGVHFLATYWNTLNIYSWLNGSFGEQQGTSLSTVLCSFLLDMVKIYFMKQRYKTQMSTHAGQWPIHVKEKTILLSDSWNQPALKKSDYLFCALFFFDTISYYNIYYFSSKSLNYSLKTTFLSWKKKIRLIRLGDDEMTSNKSLFSLDLPNTLNT